MRAWRRSFEAFAGDAARDSPRESLRGCSLPAACGQRAAVRAAGTPRPATSANSAGPPQDPLHPGDESADYRKATNNAECAAHAGVRMQARSESVFVGNLHLAQAICDWRTELTGASQTVVPVRFACGCEVFHKPLAQRALGPPMARLRTIFRVLYRELRLMAN